jgi:hypothetical protein
MNMIALDIFEIVLPGRKGPLITKPANRTLLDRTVWGAGVRGE